VPVNPVSDLGVELKDCGEDLIDIREVCPGIIIDLLDRDRAKTESTAYLRVTPASMLAKARSLLPNGIDFVVHDAWRPRLAQEKYFQYYLAKAGEKYPDKSLDELKRIASNYAIPPSDERRAGHLTGGAIDLVLWSRSARRRLPMKSSGLTFEQKANTDRPQKSPHINKNRFLLKEVMEAAGFVN
jgi:D-alanyl-D-alanine dipeptidase